jgi:hypothetical protein
MQAGRQRMLKALSWLKRGLPFTQDSEISHVTEADAYRGGEQRTCSQTGGGQQGPRGCLVLLASAHLQEASTIVCSLLAAAAAHKGGGRPRTMLLWQPNQISHLRVCHPDACSHCCAHTWRVLAAPCRRGGAAVGSHAVGHAAAAAPWLGGGGAGCRAARGRPHPARPAGRAPRVCIQCGACVHGLEATCLSGVLQQLVSPLHGWHAQRLCGHPPPQSPTACSWPVAVLWQNLCCCLKSQEDPPAALYLATVLLAFLPYT